MQSGSVLAGGMLLSAHPPPARADPGESAASPLSTDTNGAPVEIWLGQFAGATSIAGYSTADGRQRLFIADSSGLVHPLTIGPPGWEWGRASPLVQPHAGIAGLAAYFNPGDDRHHCFIALGAGDVFEVAWRGEDRSSLTEIWIGKLESGAAGIAGFPAADKSQHLFVVGRDGLVHPLEIGPGSNWAWVWREANTSYHDDIVGISAYWHPTDDAQHVFVMLKSGDVWEAIASQGAAWKENWLGVLDGGASALAGHSAANGTQHLFGAGIPGGVLPLQIGPPHWKWRWDQPVLPRRGAIVGVVSYFHPGDDQQHVTTVLQSGDIWESRFQLRSTVATREWSSSELAISYWDGPLGLANLQRDYQRVADGNFTFAMPTNAGGDVDSNRALLAAAGTAGLQMFVKDDFVQSLRASTGLTAQDKQKLQTLTDAYSGHSAYAGCQLVGQNGTDELYPNDFAINAELVAFFRSNDPGHGCFLEIIALYGDAYAPLTYEQYVEMYLSTVKPTVLCFHNYSLQADFPNSFYENIRIIRKKAIAHHRPFWQFVVSTGHRAFRSPTEAELRRQAMQVLAYGGTGVLWFTYVEEPQVEGEPKWGPAIVNLDGTPTALYPEVRRVNADVRALGSRLLNAQSIAVYESGPLAAGGVPVPQNGRVLLGDAANVTIGEFSIPVDPNSSSATQFLVMIASRDADKSVSATVTFVATTVRQLDKATGAWKADGPIAAFGTVKIDVVLAPGDAELFLVFAP